MKNTYGYPFYLIINEEDQPLYSSEPLDCRQIWLFYRKKDAFDFLKYRRKLPFPFQYPSYKKRYVIKVSLNSLEEIKEYITTIL